MRGLGLSAVPEGDWFCDNCVAQASTRSSRSTRAQAAKTHTTTTTTTRSTRRKKVCTISQLSLSHPLGDGSVLNPPLSVRGVLSVWCSEVASRHHMPLSHTSAITHIDKHTAWASRSTRGRAWYDT